MIIFQNLFYEYIYEGDEGGFGRWIERKFFIQFIPVGFDKNVIFKAQFIIKIILHIALIKYSYIQKVEGKNSGFFYGSGLM